MGINRGNRSLSYFVRGIHEVCTLKDRVSIGNWCICSYYANVQLIQFRVNELLL